MNGSSRRLLCPACARGYGPTERDVEDGVKVRKVTIPHSKVPAVHSITTTVVTGGTVTSLVHDVPLMCDHCGVSMNPGDPSVGVTMWTGEEPNNWEWEFGGPLPQNTTPEPIDDAQRRVKEKAANYVSTLWARCFGKRKPQ